MFAHVAEHDGEVGGFALWFLSFSTWTGQHGIYLEDLYVRPDLRRSGLGRALLAELARICVARGYSRLEWSVLDWNAPARGFYASLGAAEMDEWTVHRLSGAALRALADSDANHGPPARPASHHPPATTHGQLTAGGDRRVGLLQVRGQLVGGHVGRPGDELVGRLDVGRHLLGQVGLVDHEQPGGARRRGSPPAPSGRSGSSRRWRARSPRRSRRRRPRPAASAPRMPTGGNSAAATPAARPQPSPTAAPCRVGCSCFLTMLTLPRRPWR